MKRFDGELRLERGGVERERKNDSRNGVRLEDLLVLAAVLGSSPRVRERERRSSREREDNLGLITLANVDSPVETFAEGMGWMRLTLPTGREQCQLPSQNLPIAVSDSQVNAVRTTLVFAAPDA